MQAGDAKLVYNSHRPKQVKNGTYPCNYPAAMDNCDGVKTGHLFVQVF